MLLVQLPGRARWQSTQVRMPFLRRDSGAEEVELYYEVRGECRCVLLAVMPEVGDRACTGAEARAFTAVGAPAAAASTMTGPWPS